jgi:branched-chain amino acid transport system permease protein
MVLYAPGGIASILARHRRALQAGLLGRLAPAYLLAAAPTALLVAGVITLVEMSYALSEPAERGTSRLRFLGLVLEPGRLLPWIGAAAAAGAGLWLLRLAWRAVARRWEEVHAALLREGS